MIDRMEFIYKYQKQLNMTEQLLNTIGQSLIAIGLYTVAFESMVLTFRAQMQGHLQKNSPSSLTAFKNSCKTAEKTFDFCEPLIIRFGILAQADLNALGAIRRRRNKMAHEGYNHMLNLTVEEVEEDVALMFRICRKVESWRQATTVQTPDGSIPFSVAPSIFGLYLEAANNLARGKLSTETTGSNGA